MNYDFALLPRNSFLKRMRRFSDFLLSLWPTCCLSANMFHVTHETLYDIPLSDGQVIALNVDFVLLGSYKWYSTPTLLSVTALNPWQELHQSLSSSLVLSRSGLHREEETKSASGNHLEPYVKIDMNKAT